LRENKWDKKKKKQVDLCFMLLFLKRFLVLQIPRFNRLVLDEELEKDLVTFFNDKQNRNMHFERLRDLILIDKIVISNNIHLSACPKLGNQREGNIYLIFFRFIVCGLDISYKFRGVFIWVLNLWVTLTFLYVGLSFSMCFVDLLSWIGFLDVGLLSWMWVLNLWVTLTFLYVGLSFSMCFLGCGFAFLDVGLLTQY
jgi:hypothetical protein